jgi:kojibiose phosphorylase
MNKPQEAYEHFMLAARADLRNIRGNAGDGIHAASAGGLWQALVFGFAGLRLNPDGYTTAPCLPDHWQRLVFKFYQQGQQQIVDIQNQKEVIAG